MTTTDDDSRTPLTFRQFTYSSPHGGSCPTTLTDWRKTVWPESSSPAQKLPGPKPSLFLPMDKSSRNRSHYKPIYFGLSLDYSRSPGPSTRTFLLLMMGRTVTLIIIYLLHKWWTRKVGFSDGLSGHRNYV